MSSRSERLAAHVAHYLKTQPLADEASLQRNRILDKGFSRLVDEIKSEFETQVDELNHERCGSLLVCSLAVNCPNVSRNDDHQAVLFLKFDSASRTITISSERPVKFKRIIETRLASGGDGWYYACGEKKSDMSACTDVSWIVDKSLYALFGVQT
jgi:hypothetical protein